MAKQKRLQTPQAAQDEPCQRLQQAVLKHLEQSDRPLRWYYELGDLLLAHRRKSVHGENLIRGKVRAWGVPPDLSFKERAFRKAFLGENLDRLEELRTTWSAVQAVLPLKKEKKQMQMPLLEEANEKSWSVRELREHVAVKLGIPPGRGGKEKSEPKSVEPEVALHRLVKRSKDWLLHSKPWYPAVTTLKNRSPKERRAELEDRFTELVEEAKQQLLQIQIETERLQGALKTFR